MNKARNRSLIGSIGSRREKRWITTKQSITAPHHRYNRPIEPTKYCLLCKRGGFGVKNRRDPLHLLLISSQCELSYKSNYRTSKSTQFCLLLPNKFKDVPQFNSSVFGSCFLVRVCGHRSWSSISALLWK